MSAINLLGVCGVVFIFIGNEFIVIGIYIITALSVNFHATMCY